MASLQFHPYCRYVFGNGQNFIHTHVHAILLEHSLQFFIDFVGCKAYTYVRFDGTSNSLMWQLYFGVGKCAAQLNVLAHRHLFHQNRYFDAQDLGSTEFH